jgi:hypothetical protein
VPEFRVSMSIETDKLDALYKKLKPSGVTMTALLAKAVGNALVKHPVMFSSARRRRRRALALPWAPAGRRCRARGALHGRTGGRPAAPRGQVLRRRPDPNPNLSPPPPTPRTGCTPDGAGITYNANINIALAVAMPDGGLITPVLKDADRTDIYQLSRNWADLVKRAR